MCYENLTEKFNSLLEYKYALIKTREFLGQQEEFEYFLIFIIKFF